MDSEVKKASHVRKVASAKLPNLSHLISASTLARVTVPAVQSLAKVLEPELYQKISEYSQQDVDLVLSEMGASEVSTNFTNAIGAIYKLDNLKDLERFHAEGLTPEDESTGEFLVRAFIEHNQTFMKIVLRSTGDFYFDGRTYTIYQPKKIPPNLEKFQFTDEVIEIVKERCKVHFKKRSYTDFCKPLAGNYGQHHGIAVDRGSLESGSAKVAEGKSFYETDRFLKTDNMFFDKDTGFIWISVQNVNQADLKFYIELMSELLTGRTDSYEPLKFNFNFLKENSLETLLSTNFGNVAELRLRSANPTAKAGVSRKGPYTTERHPQECLSKYSDFMDNRMDENFRSVKLHAVLDKKSGLKDVIEIKGSSIKTENQIKESDMMALLMHLKVLPKGYYNA